jgi:regulator of protease activity HflC (stomatin/prohibitin superfamily)
MIIIVLSLLLTIVTIIWLAVDNEEFENTRNVKFKFRPKIFLGLLWLLLILFECYTVISTGEVGLKVRFGKIVDVINKEGIILKSPIESIEKIDIKVQKYENEAPLETSTKDMQVVNNVLISINYQIDGERAEELYRKVGSNYEAIILEPAIQEVVKGVISKYTSQEIVTQRNEIANDITNTLNEKISEYGIKCVNTNINNFDFSQEYNYAIEQQAVAEREVETSKQQLEKAKIDAEKRKVDAQAQAESNKALEQTITKEILIQKFIEKWDGHLPTTYAGEDILSIFNLK